MVYYIKKKRNHKGPSPKKTNNQANQPTKISKRRKGEKFGSTTSIKKRPFLSVLRWVLFFQERVETQSLI